MTFTALLRVTMAAIAIPLLILVRASLAFSPAKSIHAFHPSSTKHLGRRAGLSMTRVSSECEDLINSQITRELEASQLYLSASIWCETQNLVGMAAYMLSEAQEERSHAMAIIDFATKRDVPVQLDGLGAPQGNWASCLEVWETLLKSEQANTQNLFKLADAAVDSRDHALTAFLMPYHQEQVESEDHLETIISKVKDESLTPGLIRQLDTELGIAAKSGGV